MKKIWFVRKAYGWGWTPASGEGWLALSVYCILLVLLFRRADFSSHSGSDTLISFVLPFVLPFIILTCVLLAVTYWRGEPPKWQLGKKNIDTNK